MKLEIFTPQDRAYSGEVTLVQLPGSSGSFEILQNHSPIISLLTNGRIKIIEEGGKEEFVEIISGIVECNNNIVTVLAEKE